MKNTYRTAFMATCFFLGLLLPAASSDTNGPRSLQELCFKAAAYRYAQPEKLALNTVSSSKVMEADIASKSNPFFTPEHTEQIQSSIQELSAKHLDITKKFISTNDGYEICTPELRPIGVSRLEEIALRLPNVMDRLYANTLTRDDCDFLLNNQCHHDLHANYLIHLDRLAELQTKVKTHFSGLCEGHIDPNAVSVFEDQKAALSKTVDNAISLTRQRMIDLSLYAQDIRDVCFRNEIPKLAIELARLELRHILMLQENVIVA